MNIGELTKNANGFYTGKIVTLAVSMILALREVHSANEQAPRFEIFARGPNGAWVKVGALWEQTGRETGEAFLQGSIDDPSMDKRLYIACFMREDGSYAIAWSRPRRNRSDVPAPRNPQGDDETQDALDFNGEVSAPAKGKGRKSAADLGESTSDVVNA